MATEIKWADGQAITADSTIRWADGQLFVYYYEDAGGASSTPLSTPLSKPFTTPLGRGGF